MWAFAAGGRLGAGPLLVRTDQHPHRAPAATTAAAGAGARPHHKVQRVKECLKAFTPGERGPIAMANILVNIEKGIEIGAEDALKWLTGANKALHAAPQVVAALATLVGAVEKPLSDLAGAAVNPLNIPLDIQTVSDLKTVWPDVKAFLASLGVKL
jgi:hypothetical protein